MRTIRIFLASSNELEADRLAFERSVGRKKNLLKDTGISLDLKIWEDMPAHMSATSSQDEYNKEIQAADMFVLLAWNKVGRFTDEEFDIAYRSFRVCSPNCVNGQAQIGILSLNLIEKTFSTAPQFWIGIVHFLTMFCMAR